MAPESKPTEPAERLFSVQEVARLTGAEVNALRRWDRSGLVRASARDGARLRYSFRDVISVRAAMGLLATGVKQAQVRLALAALRSWRPDVPDPLASLRVFADAGRLVVRLDDALVEPASGQVLLALPVGELEHAARNLSAEVVDVADHGRVTQLRPGRGRPTGEDAQTCYERALEGESDGALPDDIEAYYRRALALDPHHIGALLNFGNLRYHRGALDEALDLYREVVRLAPDYAEGHYNLANVLDDLGQADAAVSAWEAALALAPDLKAAHFNLALAWEKQGHPARARPHWARYLELDPSGPSAEVARSFLDDQGDVGR